jgi:cysteine desulfuration protein SufE
MLQIFHPSLSHSLTHLFQTMSNILIDRVNALAAEFADLEPRERLELLLEYAENLPPLPEKYEAERQAGLHRVHECQTPVFLWVELVDGRVQIHAWVAPEAPTVKGFVGIVREIFSGLPPESVMEAETDLVARLCLNDALGMMRMRGLSAVLFHIRKNIQSLIDNQIISTS